MFKEINRQQIVALFFLILTISPLIALGVSYYENKKQKEVVFIPAGSILKAELLHGLSIPTATIATYPLHTPTQARKNNKC